MKLQNAVLCFVLASCLTTAPSQSRNGQQSPFVGISDTEDADYGGVQVPYKGLTPDEKQLVRQAVRDGILHVGNVHTFINRLRNEPTEGHPRSFWRKLGGFEGNRVENSLHGGFWRGLVRGGEDRWDTWIADPSIGAGKIKKYYEREGAVIGTIKALASIVTKPLSAGKQILTGGGWGEDPWEIIEAAAMMVLGLFITVELLRLHKRGKVRRPASTS